MRYAVVTGITKGIGRAVGECLLNRGYHVIGNYAADDRAAEEFLHINRDFSSHLKLFKLDLSSYKGACQFARSITENASTLDVLILNSGTTDRTPFGAVTEESWMRVMDVNLNAPFFLVQALSKHMTPDVGRIIFIGSSMGEYPHGQSIAYGVSKAAVHELSKYLVKHFSGQGITVNSIAPGFVDTPWQKGKAPEHRERIESKVALHRFADPEEIAALCVHVIENQYINGAVLDIDGGYCFE